MRTHGWQGEPPTSDDEAVARIIAATHRCVDERGAQTTIAHVAAALGVSRATVYRYFPSTSALLHAAAADGTRRFLERMGEQLRSFDDVTEAIIDGVVQTVAAVPREPYLQLLLDEPSHTLLRSVTSEAALHIGRAMLLENTAIDWTQVNPDVAGLDELVEWALRIVQSFLTNPGDPARTPEQLRAHLQRWLGPAVREWAASSALSSALSAAPSTAS
ncbi:TetR family transcriptional regulator [Mycolicibacterium duvalii]|uniref:TetR family transcriptional regulator n=1 Tax=Mycolicibacterium duvalii TaxID=39688 RepID=A0A7I7K4X9_9MYCO|nr:TetR/AcrR family transcriptional regulator [Mycolicibacterium duvalii]MCV7367746.1 TetR/AcrR family transcriptional regulator [Mycolicibacterium duvalii]PEG39426.1 TetR family transcriptional regulator [Mycolicibacterium duvalii]BBX18664.1 TetR family transcriptional regulator [Mycolicibacterium duvalii]